MAQRKLYRSKGGFILGSHWPEGKEGFLYEAQAEPYLDSLLEEVKSVKTEAGEVAPEDTGKAATAIDPPKPDKQRVFGKVAKNAS